VAQNTFTIITRINRGDLDAFDRLLSEIGQEVEKNERIRFAEIASLHMAGIVIAARDPRFAPILIFESNFDGTADEYLHELVSHGRAGIDEIYSKCEGYPAEAARTDTTVVAYLWEHGQPAAAFFVGLPGQTVASIRNAIAVREEINRFLDVEPVKNSIQGLSAVAIRDRIVAHLEHDSPVKPEIPPNTFSSYRRIAPRNTIVAAVAAFIVGVILFPLIAIWVLTVQKIVPPSDRPVDARTYAMEDLFIQNHLATIGVVKDNPVRRFSIRTAVALTGILFQRILLRGGLGGVFTLHFAHVVWLDEGRRILLLTGYDGSALEYLGNFTDTAGYYLNGAYGNVNNYPACKWIIGRGAASANGFSNWATQHMQYTPVFYSAYPDETVLNLMKDLDIRYHLSAATSESEVARLPQLL
jgi:hypothetical protein